MNSSSNLADPLILHELVRCRETVTKNAYLLALAAFQRGLAVTFHHDFFAVPRFSMLQQQGFYGEMFSVSDGTTTRYFRRSHADTVTREVSARCENKQHTKRVLHEAGVQVPPGLLLVTGSEPEIGPFVSRFSAHPFVLKPLAGSLGDGVVRSIPADAVSSEIAKVAGSPHLLEVYLQGREFRVNVLGDQVVMGHERVPAHVVGDGVHSVSELVEAKNHQRQNHPLYAPYPILQDRQSEKCLAEQGLTLDSIPQLNALVWINRIPGYRYGGHNLINTPDLLTDSMRRTCLAAAKAVGIEFTGLDVIVLNHGTNKEQAFVLELNQSPDLAGALGDLNLGRRPAPNTVAETLIDFHFPASVNNKRFVRASFDMASIVEALASGAAARVDLPVLSADWQHLRMTVSKEQVAKISLQDALRRLRAAGYHVRFVRAGSGDLVIDAVVPGSHLDIFKHRLAAVGIHQ